MSDEDFLERLHSLRADAPDYGETSRAENTHGEFLRRLKDWEALSKLDEGTVLHIWRRSERCEDCELCSFLESEVDRVGLFGAQVWQIWRFALAYRALKNWINQTIFEQNLAKEHHHDEDDRDAGEHKDEESKENCLVCSSNRTTSLSERPEDVEPATAYEFAMDVVFDMEITRRYHAFSEIKKITDPILLKSGKVLQVMGGFLGTHTNSESCLACQIVAGHGQDPEELTALGSPCDDLSLPRRRELLRNHKLPFAPRRLSQRDAIREVRIGMIHKGSWHGLSLEEYRRSAKHGLIPRRRRPSNSLDPVSTAPDISESLAVASGSSRRIPSPRLPSTIQAPEQLEKAYRQHAKDMDAFIPQYGEHTGSARPVKAKFDVDLLNYWLTSCQARHGDVCRRNAKQIAPQGMILLDTEDMCLRHVGDGVLPSYFALSYVWGAIHQPVLTTHNLERWKQPGSLKRRDIPTTIRDAIAITQESGLRYLWVDAMCIVQNDPELRSIQIQQMYLIYNQAELTIIDGSGNDCMNGLSGVSHLEDRWDKESTYTIGDVTLSRVLQEPRYGLEASPWRTRGWTFQEELCSRRAVVFLPNVVLFSCMKSLWREDIRLEGEIGPKPSGYLNSLPAPTGQLLSLSERISVFRDLVKQFIKRVLTRIDDIENAFAGIAGMLEYATGPLYHGIPEKDFVYVIDGCWFWNMGVRPRLGFSSWSWTGWIYAAEQADTGIAPLPNLGTTVGLIQFYVLEHEAVRSLWSEGSPNLPTTEDLRDHFEPNEAQVQHWWSEHGVQEVPSRGLIGFFTSLLHLRVRAPRGLGAGQYREFSVCSPITGAVLTSLTLPEDFLRDRDALQPFIAIAYSAVDRSFRIMLVEFNDGICTKVNVTAPRRRIHEEIWWSLGPERRLIIMN
ncbi:uncharacterized protein E0L32_006125 [Thyridium curvatum]|uniref:Heterokaryon incompatibility domain-containing protein n=1 Tax=Thyridium curvatum TaxID=1093900 RepID=A0A507ARE8_9PEZI|nr:uncharacterized protein E0L32_006125 [Thyridium curvatum]TPX13395.1 hypothetical protein E0L32_006125 [Thyridium curvatum]